MDKPYPANPGADAPHTERYHLTRTTDNDGYAFVIQEVSQPDPTLIPALTELDLLTYSEPTFSRFTLGAILRYGRVFLARADDLVIGAIHCLRSFEDTDEVTIFNMALRPGWRGHGLGSRFLTAVLEKLRAHGIRAVTLQVAENNHRAISVYREKMGFTVVAVHADEYHSGQRYLMLRLHLDGSPVQGLGHVPAAPAGGAAPILPGSGNN